MLADKIFIGLGRFRTVFLSSRRSRGCRTCSIFRRKTYTNRNHVCSRETCRWCSSYRHAPANVPATIQDRHFSQRRTPLALCFREIRVTSRPIPGDNCCVFLRFQSVALACCNLRCSYFFGFGGRFPAQLLITYSK